jgi:hypothetical protein
MSTGDAYRPLLHDLHFNADWSFQIVVVRAPRPVPPLFEFKASVPSLWMAILPNQRCLSTPKCAAAIAAPVAESSPHSSNKSITYMKF